MSEAVLASIPGITSKLTAPDGDFPVIEAVVAGGRRRVFRDADRQLGDVLARQERQFADRTLIWEEGRSFTYAEVFGAARRLAGALRDELGVVAGDHVAIAMRNRLEWIQAFVAIQYLGATGVLVNSRGAPDELAAAVNDTECLLVLADDERAAAIAGGGGKARVLALEAVRRMAAEGAALADPARVAEDAPCLILFTSGTTGRPKGAVLTQRNLTNLIVNLRFITALNLELMSGVYGMPAATLRGMMPSPSVLLVSPLFHISGLTGTLVALDGGGMLTLVRRWNAAALVPVIAANKVTMLSGPPLIVGDLLAQEGAAEALANVVGIGIGGQATPPALIDRMKAAMPRATPSVGWGSTETSGSVTAAMGMVYAARPASAGIASPIADISARDDAGRPVETGAMGELCVRSALVMQGYYNAPEATAAAFAGEWLRTGDVGYLDELGFVHICDRLKDMVICGGENIYCAEVERVLASDPDIVEVALFGVPDERLGERSVVAVAVRDGAARSEEEVKARVRAQLADYKVPSAVAFGLAPFPRNASGKVLKPKLRERYLQQVGEHA